MPKISRTKAVELIRNSRGRFFSITYVKNNGKQDRLNGNVSSKALMTALGYILFNSSKEGKKSINPRTIKDRKSVV